MNTQRFTHYWNVARFVVIGIAAVLFLFLTLRAECSGFAPNIEVDHFDRNDAESDKSDFQKSQEACEDSRHDDDYHSYTDNKGNDHHFKDGAELG